MKQTAARLLRVAEGRAVRLRARLRGQLSAAALSLACTSLTLATSVAASDLPSFAAVRQAHRPSDLLLLDRNGQPLQSVRIDAQARRLPWLELAQFSPALRELIVQGEDQRFWSHGGIDWSGAARSALANAQGSTQGASTLTMQLAALLDPELARPSGGRSVRQKWSQIGAARSLESQWRKPEILEAYLNRVPLRGELVGMPAAAWALFGKHPSGLDRSEAALLVALVRAPNAKEDAVVRRGCALLNEGPRCERIAALAERTLKRNAGPPLVEPLAPHFARWQIGLSGMPKTAAPLRTTIDSRLQRSAAMLLRTQMAELQGRQVEDGALLVLDNASGEVRAWVGSTGVAWSDAPEVDAVLARRQPGSTMKPFVYALAIDQGLITPASLLHDAPVDLDGGSGAFMPRNYDHHYRGWVSARTALASSLNVPAARLGALIGPQAMFDGFNRAGLQLNESAGFHGLAMALGSADVTLLQLTNAYRMLANRGRWSPVRGMAGAPLQVMRETTAFQIGDMLSDSNARAATFGLDSALVTRSFAAVKTGTSKDMRDNWCIGFTDRYTIGVWVGNASGEAMHRVSGTQGAAPVWRALVQQLHAGSPSQAPRVPAGLQRQSVVFDAGLEAPRDEWLLTSTLINNAGSSTASHGPLRIRAGEQLAQQRPSGITSPRDGSIFALDPDMPAPVQRIKFSGEAGQWWLDGRLIGSGTQLSWAPWPGRHSLVLKSASGQALGSTRFEVRGATVKR